MAVQMCHQMFRFFLILSVSMAVCAQMNTRTTNGISDKRLAPTALVGGTVVVRSGEVRRDKVLLIEDGRVAGLSSVVPDGYRVVDVAGAYVYPALVDFYSHYGMPPVKADTRSRWRGPEVLATTSTKATNANEAIKSHVVSAELFKVDEDAAEKLRKSGFASVLSFQPDGIARGTSVALLTGDGLPNEQILRSKVATHYSFSKGSSSQFYPVSRMGVVSLLRQTELDANW